MSLADTIEAVRGGKSPEVARLEFTKERTPFGERLLKAVKNVPERAVRKMARIDDMDLPEDFNAAEAIAIPKGAYREKVPHPVITDYQ